MRLLRGVHPAEKDNLGRGEVRLDRTRFHALFRCEEGMPELAGTVAEANISHGRSNLSARLAGCPASVFPEFRGRRDYNIGTVCAGNGRQFRLAVSVIES